MMSVDADAAVALGNRSPLRLAADQVVVDELEDAALNLRLDLEELRSTTLQYRDLNLAWVAQVAEEVTFLLMSLQPFQVAPAAAGAVAAHHHHASPTSRTTSPRGLAASTAAAPALGSSIRAVPNHQNQQQHQRNGTNTSPPLHGVAPPPPLPLTTSSSPREGLASGADGGGGLDAIDGDDAAATGVNANHHNSSRQQKAVPAAARSVALPQLRLQSRPAAIGGGAHSARQASSTEATVAPPPSLTARRLVVRPLGTHTEMLSVEARQQAVERALRLAAGERLISDDTDQSESPTRAGVPSQQRDAPLSSMALLTPVRGHPAPPSSREGGTTTDTAGGRTALRLSTTTFGETVPPPPPASRGGTRASYSFATGGLRRGRLADPTDARLTAEGRHDQELLRELEEQQLYSSSRPAANAATSDASGGAALADIYASFANTMPRYTAAKFAPHATDAEASWVVPLGAAAVAGQNYREPFLANLSALSVEPAASYATSSAAAVALVSSSSPSPITAAADVVVAVPGSGAPSGPAVGEHKRFQSYVGRRMRHQQQFAAGAGDVAFGSSTSNTATTPRPPPSRERGLSVGPHVDSSFPSLPFQAFFSPPPTSIIEPNGTPTPRPPSSASPRRQRQQQQQQRRWRAAAGAAAAAGGAGGGGGSGGGAKLRIVMTRLA